jgi:uncharacterized membrane protein
VVAAGTGFLIALYMGLFQVGLFSSVWDPIFGDGSRRVLTSELSHALVIPDSLLGAMVYLADVVTGSIGGADRWRTRPWVVFAFGIVIGPLGLVSVVLVIVQPVVVGAWCFLCLMTALISVTMIGPAMAEVLASLQLLKRARREGLPVWDVLWGRLAESERLVTS